MKRFLAAAVFTLALLAMGCNSGTYDGVGPYVEMREYPSVIAANVDRWYTFRASVSSGDYSESLYCEVHAPGGITPSGFLLHDDGGQVRLEDPERPVYQDTVSGDVIANNLDCTARINGHLLYEAFGVIGDYQFFILAGPRSGMVVLTIPVENIAPCIITEYPQQTAFESCFEPIPLTVRVDPADRDRVDTVAIQLLDGSENLLANALFTPTGDPAVWTFNLTPSFFRCYAESIVRPHHFLRYRAVTQFGQVCTAGFEDPAYVQHVPILSNSVMPDTAYRPASPSDTNLIVVTVNMDDCELAGATDFFGLWFDARRDTQDWPPQHVTNFFLRNDGTEPDAQAGDNVFSSWLAITNVPSLPNNMYYFRFYALDGFGYCSSPVDTSEYVLDSIRIIQSSGILGGPIDPHELGIAVR